MQVYGIPDERYGEQVAAAIIPRQDATPDEEEIRDYCQKNIAYFKVPHYIWFVEEYPMTASGKIQKYKLRQAAVETLGLAETAGN